MNSTFAPMYANAPISDGAAGQTATSQMTLGDILANTFAALAANAANTQPLGLQWATGVKAGDMSDRIVAKRLGYTLSGPPLSQYEKDMP